MSIKSKMEIYLMSYTKLFTEIIHSTIWTSSLTDKVVWITMLAMADSRGEVRASVPGLARIAGVSREECLIALDSFLRPDIDSRSQEYEGRRIKEVDGGWLLINHGKYRALRSAEERKRYQADWMANKRRKDKDAENETKKIIKPKENILPKDISEKLWEEWMAVRKSKKAVNSQTAIDALIKSLENIQAHGRWTKDDAIKIAIENSWKSIKLEWLENLNETHSRTNKKTSAELFDDDYASIVEHGHTV